MAAGRFGIRHAAGLGFAVCLGLLCYGAWQMVPGWLAGTPLRDLSPIVTFAVLIGILSLGERLWAVIAARLPDADAASPRH